MSLSAARKRFVRPTANRAAFSLIELVVAIGVLSLMMLLAGQVFKISVDSTGQATALIEVNQSLRLLEETLREDLAGVDPSRSMLGIKAVPVGAYWTKAQQEGDIDGFASNGFPHDGDVEREDLYGPNRILLDGDEDINSSGVTPPYALERPRADILMFFTSRNVTSALYPDKSGDQAMVVYSHASLGELSLTVTPDWVKDPVPPSANSVAADWHLARRCVLILDTPRALPDIGIPGVPREPSTTNSSTGAEVPVPAIVNGSMDIIARDREPAGGPSCELFLKTLVAPSEYPECPPLPPLVGYPAYRASPPYGNGGYTLIHDGWMARSELDLTPPPSKSGRLAHYFIPRCASFKVEWGLEVKIDSAPDTPVLIWVDPADIRNSVLTPLKYQLALYEDNPTPPRPDFEVDGGRRFDPNRTDPPPPPTRYWSLGRTHVFLNRDFEGSNFNAPDPYFPKALRITVDVFDRAGNFLKPIRHVMVIPVGEQDS